MNLLNELGKYDLNKLKYLDNINGLENKINQLNNDLDLQKNDSDNSKIMKTKINQLDTEVNYVKTKAEEEYKNILEAQTQCKNFIY